MTLFLFIYNIIKLTEGVETMKHMKKLLSSVLVLMLGLAITMSWASAAEVAHNVLVAEKAVATLPVQLMGENAKNASYLKTYFGVEDFSPQ